MNQNSRCAAAARIGSRHKHIKDVIRRVLPVGDDALHIHLGLVTWLLAIWLLRLPPGSVVPVLVVLAVESINETLDAVQKRALEVRHTLIGIANTLLWPRVLSLLAHLL